MPEVNYTFEVKQTIFFSADGKILITHTDDKERVRSVKEITFEDLLIGTNDLHPNNEVRSKILKNVIERMKLFVRSFEGFYDDVKKEN